MTRSDAGKVFTLISRTSVEPRRFISTAALLLCIALVLTAFFPSPAAGSEVTREQARAAAEGFLLSRANDARGELAVERIREVESAGGVFAFIADLAPAGFVIVSADTRIAPILGYNFSGTLAFRDLAYSPLLHLVLADVSARLRMAAKHPEEPGARVAGNERRWRRIFIQSDGSGAGEAETWGPLLQQDPNPNNRHEWGQVVAGEQGDYNASCPLVVDALETGRNLPGPPVLTRPPVGCAVISICQIMEYWQHPKYLELLSEEEDGNGRPPGEIPGGGQVGVRDIESPDNYQFLRCMFEDGGQCRLEERIRIPEDAVLRDFSGFEDLSGEITYNSDFASLTDGFFRIGLKLRTRYGSRGSAVEATAERYLDEYLFGSARQVEDPGGVWNRATAGIASANIRLGRPCHLSIKGLRLSDELPVFHSVVLDGYRSTGEFHLTFGWDGTGNTWYSLPDLLVAEGEGDDADFEFDVIRKLIYDISPEKAWAQFGANERNSFQSPYAAPLQAPLSSKWRVNTSGAGEFKGVIVGQGNTLFATVSGTPRSAPALWKISQFGEVRARLEFENETGGITWPVQNSRGEIFVGFDSGKIYRIDPALRSSLQLFPPLDGDFPKWFGEGGPISLNSLAISEVPPGSPPHVEERLYFRTEGIPGEEAISGFYTIDPDGTPHGLDGTMMSALALGPVINSVRNRLYYSFFDFCDAAGYVVSIDTETRRQAARSRAFLPAEQGVVGAPSIDEEGNVYVYVGGHLAKMDWNLQLTQPMVELSPQPITTNVPVIGTQGNVILSHLVFNQAGEPALAVSSLDRETLEPRWVWSRPADSMAAIPGQAWSASNDVVVVMFSRPALGGVHPDDTDIVALRDRGDDFSELWTHRLGQGHSYSPVAGPGASFYLFGASPAWEGEWLYAFSEGETGNPREAGRNFVNNSPPGEASNPSPPDGSLGVEADAEAQPEVCDNEIDDDLDGDADCSDPDCADDPLCEDFEREICDNGLDDDLDGDVDCLDAECVGHRLCVEPEICENMVDDDGDGLVDCEDLDCANHPNCVNRPPGGGIGAGIGDGFGAGRRDGPPIQRTVTWDESEDADGHDLSYDVLCCERAGGDELFVTIAEGLSEPSYTFTGLRGGTTYLWKVNTTDGGILTEGPEWEFTTVNQPPVASAGADVTSSSGEMVSLDAILSSDPDDNMLQFSWDQVSGPEVDLEFPDNDGSTLGAIQGSSLLQFLAPDDLEEEITLVFEVTVYDGLTSREDLVTVTLRPSSDEICDNAIDDDGDGDADCDDTECAAEAACAKGGGPTFVRADANSDGAINLTDGVIPLLFLFSGGAAPDCPDAADTNDSGAIEITDAIIIFSWLFTGGDAPVAPTPLSPGYSAEECGVDPTVDELGCELRSPTCE